MPTASSPFPFLWMVRLRQQRQVEEAVGGRRTGASGAARTRGTKVRTRCGGNWTPLEEVREQVEAAMPQIVRANVKMAKSGSLVHTKWLWGVVEKLPKRDENAMEAKRSLAALLMEQLGEVL